MITTGGLGAVVLLAGVTSDPGAVVEAGNVHPGPAGVAPVTSSPVLSSGTICLTPGAA
ncbi:hypothetical protein [Microtetraspora malaysiensis]|uniref:hypothetical protein n=1 Tax=Microtetraspora malaysiensis TaxID=161358 RepID=UPI003D90C810